MRARFKNKNLKALLPVYLATFFFFFHYNSLVYVNSSYLGQFFDPSMVGFIYILGALGNIFFIFLALKWLSLVGNRRFLSYFLCAELIAVTGLALVSTPLAMALLFILFDSTALMILYSLDIFLEDATPENQTGSVRGMSLTLGNLALVLSPLLIGLVAPNGEFSRLYLVSAIFLVPLFFLAAYSFRGFKDGHQRFSEIPLKAWWHSKNIRRVTLVRLALDTFYSFMVIYMPIYLHTHIGFAWSEISIIFTIMLLPFILFEIPVGRLADKWCGEKEIMTLGLFIMGCVLIMIPFLHSASIPLWAILLFFSRTGASITEVTAESYFFKHVDKRDAGMISIYRMAYPTAFMIGSLIASFSLAILPFEAIFLILSVIVLKAMDTSSKLQDTK
ncbi:MAG: MFS transporter [Patescibacteria group bacterium]